MRNVAASTRGSLVTMVCRPSEIRWARWGCPAYEHTVTPHLQAHLTFYSLLEAVRSTQVAGCGFDALPILRLLLLVHAIGKDWRLSAPHRSAVDWQASTGRVSQKQRIIPFRLNVRIVLLGFAPSRGTLAKQTASSVATPRHDSRLLMDAYIESRRTESAPAPRPVVSGVTPLVFGRPSAAESP